MTSEERVRKKIVLTLKKEMGNSDNPVTSSKVLITVLAIIGWAGVTVSFLESLEPHIPIYVISLIGIIGGISLTLATWLNQVKLNLPIIKELLSHEAVNEAAKKYEP
jgi:hypothetical protein